MYYISSYKGYQCTMQIAMDDQTAERPKNTVYYAKDVTLNRSTDEADATTRWSGGFSNPCAGLKSWSVDFDMVLVFGDPRHDILDTAWQQGHAVKVNLILPNQSGGIYKQHFGQAFVSDFTQSEPVGDAVTVSVSLTGMGQLT